MESHKLSKKDFTDDGLKKIINRDIAELNHLSDKDLISLWSFFKFLSTDAKDLVFLTEDDSIIYRNREVLRKKGIKIFTMSEFARGDVE